MHFLPHKPRFLAASFVGVIGSTQKRGRNSRPRLWHYMYSSNSGTKTSKSNDLTFDLDMDLAQSEYRQAIYRDDVPCAVRLRRAYDEAIFGDPRDAPPSSRFAWDPWYVGCSEGRDGKLAPLPGDEQQDGPLSFMAAPISGERDAAAGQTQYCLKRSQADFVFDDESCNSLLDDVTALGRSIGCAGTTPPWISLYMDGDMQNFHTDGPHGPMAWTLSLTLDEDYNSRFTGGETMLLQPRILDYWRDYSGSGRGLEAPSIVRYLPPAFGRCVAFDGRIPHGVNRVSGGRDPRHCRVVIHGWFSEPEPVWFGEFEDDEEIQSQGASILDAAMEPLTEVLGGGEIGRVVGFLSVRLVINPDGTVEEVNTVCDTLVADPGDWRGVVGEDEEGREVFEDAPVDLKLTVRETLAHLVFPVSDQGGSAVVPFEFL